MDHLLRHLADQRWGKTFTTAEARRCGHGAKELATMVRRRESEHLGRGLYAVATQDLSSLDRHRRLGEGVLLQYPDASLSHHTALVAHGIPCWGADLRTAILQRDVESERRSAHVIVKPRYAAPVPIRTALGMAAPVSYSLILHTLRSGAAAGVVAADYAVHEKLTTLGDLEQDAERCRGWPRFGRVRTMLAHLDGRSESVGESRLRLDLSFAGIPVVPQVVVSDHRGRFVARVDLMVDGTKVVIEFDGLVKYREGGAAALVAEKKREDALRALGYIVVRVTWSDLSTPRLVIARVRRAVEIAESLVPG